MAFGISDGVRESSLKIAVLGVALLATNSKKHTIDTNEWIQIRGRLSSCELL